MSGKAWLLTALAMAAAGAGGVYAGQHGLAWPKLISVVDQDHPARQPTGPVLYYQDPDSVPAYALTPHKTADGRDYRAVYEDPAIKPAATQTAVAASPESSPRKILYYRNPMGLPDTSRTPKKDSMGMDYIPVYDGDEEGGDTIKISTAKQQRSGVQSEPANLRTLSMPVRAPAALQLDERRQTVVSMRSDAWIQEVANVTTGDHVHKGDLLMQVYSPIVTSVAIELVLALASGNEASTAAKAAGRRLENAGVPGEVIDEIIRTRQVPRSIPFSAPSDGIVMERNATPGMQAAAGQVIFRIANHDVIWVLANVTERDLGLISAGQSAKIVTRAYPGKTFTGQVALVYPDLDATTRTGRVRIELPNLQGLLKPDMYADVEIATGTPSPTIAIPNNAVIDSGTRQVVIIDKGDGRFEPRPVTLGKRNDGYVEVSTGLKEGELVVTAANFLLDAESNLKAALRGLSSETRP